MQKRKDKTNADPKALAEAASLSPELALRSLEQIIEAERGQLLQAYSVLKCVYEVLLYSDHENALHHADAASLAAQLIDGVAERLDLVNLRARLAEMKGELEAYPDNVSPNVGSEGVRDAAWPTLQTAPPPRDRRH